MSASALIFMIVVCGLVWGGFSGLLIRALRREGRKSSSRS